MQMEWWVQARSKPNETQPTSVAMFTKSGPQAGYIATFLTANPVFHKNVGSEQWPLHFKVLLAWLLTMHGLRYCSRLGIYEGR